MSLSDFCAIRWSTKYNLALCSVSQKSTLKTFCDIFIYVSPVLLNIIVAIAQTYSYVYTNFSPFIKN